VLKFIGKVIDVSERIGLDIGGTLAKMAFMQPAGEDCAIGEQFGLSGRRHKDLAFELTLRNKPYQVHFVSGSTASLERALLAAASEAPPRGPSLRRIVASGGGAHRFAKAVREVLNVEMLPFQEMESLVSGLEFLRIHNHEEEVFMVGEDDCEEECPWPDPFFPCLLVNMGSGVSILRIDRSPDAAPAGEQQNEGLPVPSFVRLGGTACGGATFLGLARLITSATSFDEALELARRGDATRVNKLVGDIYGESGCESLGMPARLTAAYFGKLMTVEGNVRDAADDADTAAALLRMVVQESVVLARAFSQLVHAQVGHAPPVFFVGGFLADNHQARSIIASTFRTFKLGPAMFLRHADFLGAVGSLGQCLHFHSLRASWRWLDRSPSRQGLGRRDSERSL